MHSVCWASWRLTPMPLSHSWQKLLRNSHWIPVSPVLCIRRNWWFFGRQPQLDEISLVYFLRHSEQQEPQNDQRPAPKCLPENPEEKRAPCSACSTLRFRHRRHQQRPEPGPWGEGAPGAAPRDYNTQQPPLLAACMASPAAAAGLSFGPPGLWNIPSLLAKKYVF